MNKKSLLLGIKLFTTWVLIVALISAILALSPSVLGFVIACAFAGAAAKLQEQVVFD